MCLWLLSVDMEQYAADFTARGVDGTQLLSLDGEKLKVRATLLVYKVRSILNHRKLYFKTNNDVNVKSDAI